MPAHPCLSRLPDPALHRVICNLWSCACDEKVKSVYLAAESSFTEKYDLLQWAEGLIDLFDDRESAEEIFRKMADKFNQPGDRSVFQNREMNRFEAGQDYLKPIRLLTN